MSFPDWLQAQRNVAMQKFSSLEIPKENDEPWRYTDLRMLKLPSVQLSNGQSKITMKLENAISLKEAIASGKLQESYFNLQMADKFEAMNAASWQDGFFIHAKGKENSNISISSNTSTKNIIILEPNSSLTVFYQYDCTGLSTDFTQVFASEGSRLDFVTARKSTNAFNFSNMKSNLQKDASINQFVALSGDNLTRFVADTEFNGKGSSAEISSIFFGRNKGHIDITTNAYHNVPETSNKMISKGVLYGNSSSVYRGMIKIEKPAVKTSSYLSDTTLKMGADALANSIPSLKIDAADVQAGHKAAIGKIDEEQIYYLMSRGLSREEAEKMIVDGFFSPLLSKLPQNMKEAVEAIVKR